MVPELICAMEDTENVPPGVTANFRENDETFVDVIDSI